MIAKFNNIRIIPIRSWGFILKFEDSGREYMIIDQLPFFKGTIYCSSCSILSFFYGWWILNLFGVDKETLVQEKFKIEQLIHVLNTRLDRYAKEDLLTVRLYKRLIPRNIRRISDLLQKTEKDLLGIKHLGHKSLNFIKEILVDKGFSLMRK